VVWVFGLKYLELRKIVIFYFHTKSLIPFNRSNFPIFCTGSTGIGIFDVKNEKQGIALTKLIFSK